MPWDALVFQGTLGHNHIPEPEQHVSAVDLLCGKMRPIAKLFAITAHNIDPSHVVWSGHTKELLDGQSRICCIQRALGAAAGRQPADLPGESSAVAFVIVHR